MLVVILFGNFSLSDTISKENWSFFKKIEYTIGYSGGICYTGEDLRPYGNWEEGIFSIPFYLLQSIEGGIVYPLSGKRRIEIGIGYGWHEFHDCNGWSNNFPLHDTSNSYGHLEGGGSFSFKRFTLFLYPPISFLKLGIELGYSILESNENLYYYNITDEAKVIRHLFGIGAIFSTNCRILLSEHFESIILLSMKFSSDFECLRYSPFEWTHAEKKMMLYYSGPYLGIKIKIRR